MDCSKSYEQNSKAVSSIKSKAAKIHCGFKKSLEKLPECRAECKLAHANLEPKNQAPRKVYKNLKRIDNKSVDLLLSDACKKLETVLVDRYIMRQQAKIEGCKKGMDWKTLKNLDWFDYSECPKKYISLKQH